MKKNIYMTIDTETVGGATKPTGAYNYGGVIHDKQGTIYATFSILVMEHYDEIAKDDYAKRNFPIYKERLNNGYITAVATEADAILVIRNLCRFYHVNYIMAYNQDLILLKPNVKSYSTNLNLLTFISWHFKLLHILQVIANSALKMKKCQKAKRLVALRQKLYMHLFTIMPTI